MIPPKAGLIGLAALFLTIALTWGTPEFATTRPSSDQLRPVTKDERFQLSLVRVELQSHVGFSCFYETRPVRSDAWNPPVTVLWLVNDALALRFSSRGCKADEVQINGEIHRGSRFIVLADGTVKVDASAGPLPLLELVSEAKSSSSK